MGKSNGRRNGIIVGVALILGVALGGFWADLGSPRPVHVTEASSCGQVFLGRGGTVNTCNRIPDDKVSRNIKRGVGSTFTGCALGLASGGPVGAGWGCLGGFLSNIPWAGW